MIEYSNCSIIDYKKYHKNDSPESLIIIHIGNCVACRPHGLSETITVNFKYANTYGDRICTEQHKNLARVCDRPNLGSLKIDTLANNPNIICCFSQFKMGKANSTYFRCFLDQHYTENAKKDTKELREKMFAICLIKIKKWIKRNDHITRIAIPYGIGCGLAGGTWFNYRNIIDVILSSFCRNKNIELALIKYKK